MRRTSFGMLAAALCLAAGCGPVPDPAARAQQDLRPPSIESVRSVGPGEVELCFDEEAELAPESLRFTPDLAVTDIPGPGTRIVLAVARQVCGLLYTLEAEARDARGNTLSFAAEFYGYNSHVPRVLLNEFTPRGSDAHPDLLELKVLSAGDMGGLVLYQGTPGDYDDRFVFPSFAVGTGDFVLVHFKPSGSADEINESGDKAASGGLDSSRVAFDFWVTGGAGISGNNGVLCLYERPGGNVMDGVLYSNRTSASDEDYGGFGSSHMLQRARELAACGGWKTASDSVAPEDGVNPEGSTSTRSICRSSGSADTDRAADWHVVPTRCSTFGADNSDEVYVMK